MKRYFITIFLLCVAAVNISAQTTTVAVDQSFIDAANTAFKEVVALRQAVEALGKANTANANAVEAYRQVNELLKADNADLRKLKCDETRLFFGLIKNKRCK